MIKTARAHHEGGTRFTIATGSGHQVVVDDADGDASSRPAELLMVPQAGCTAMDVASILAKKRQSFASYEVAVDGEQRDDPHPHVYRRIEIVRTRCAGRRARRGPGDGSGGPRGRRR